MRTVTVTGQGTAREVPDTVVVRVSAAHRAAGVAEALAGADSAATEIVAVGASSTRSRRRSPRPTSTSGRPTTTRASSPASRPGTACSSRAPTSPGAGALLAELATAVGDRLQVEGLGLEVADPGRALSAARAAAYADAVGRAGHLAELAGARLGEVQAMAEGSVVRSPFTDLAAGGRRGQGRRIEPGETAV